MIVGGVGAVGTAVLFYLAGSTAANIASSSSGSAATVFAGVGAIAGIIFLLFGILEIALAIGILQMRDLARILTIVLLLVMAAGSVLGLAATLMHYSQVGLLWNLSLLVLDALILLYLLQPSTKKAFERGKPLSAAPGTPTPPQQPNIVA
jgi:hypothetical protein